MSKLKTLSIVIPVYNEEKFIKTTIEKVVKADTLGLKKEIIVVDDGSEDKTPLILKALEKNIRRRKLRFFLNKNNQGKGYALKTGFMKTTGDIVLVQDADLEYNPDDYPLLLKPFLEHGADVVYGSRLVTYCSS